MFFVFSKTRKLFLKLFFFEILGEISGIFNIGSISSYIVSLQPNIRSKCQEKKHEGPTNNFKIVPQFFRFLFLFFKSLFSQIRKQRQIKIKEKNLGRVCQTCTQSKIKGKNYHKNVFDKYTIRSRTKHIFIFKLGLGVAIWARPIETCKKIYIYRNM